ncbi:hypothetical protein TW65_01835 [Stemphylium lycopersici]|nr:hypothetical protein TW65_01835 [Stemphylium lycopersici]
MTQPEVSATTPPQRNLLNLPGELRNRICEWVIEGTQSDVRLRSPPYPLWLACRAPNRVLRWELLRRETLGLTQTCRKLRDEFLPLHQQHVIVQLWNPEDLRRYLAEFFPNNEEPHGTVKLSVPPEHAKLEVLPFIHALCSAPKLDLRFVDMPKDDKETLSRLCDVRGNRNWAGFVERLVTRISYIGDWTADQQLIVEIKNGAWKHCVTERIPENSRINVPGDSNNYEKADVVKRWLESIKILSQYVIEEIVEIRMEDSRESRNSKIATASPNDGFAVEEESSEKSFEE